MWEFDKGATLCSTHLLGGEDVLAELTVIDRNGEGSKVLLGKEGTQVMITSIAIQAMDIIYSLSDIAASASLAHSSVTLLL